MPYIGEDTSLEKWLASCQEVCDAERVRSFLKDAQMFCQQQFGETPMSMNPDVLFVHDYLSTNPSQLRAALAIHDAWIPVRDVVCERFLEHLCKAVKDRARDALKDIAPDCNVWCNYEGERKYSNGLWISRDDWVRYSDVPGHLDKCTQIRLEVCRPRSEQMVFGGQKPEANRQNE